MPTPGPGFNVDPQGNATPGSPATGAYRKKDEQIAQPFDWAGGGPTKEPTGEKPGQPVNPAVSLNRRQRMHKVLSDNQFKDKPAAQKIARGLSIYDTSKAFRSAGFSSAARYAVGAPEIAPQLHKLLEGRALRQAASGGHGIFPEDTGGFTSGEGA